jgi:hypothetical protein
MKLLTLLTLALGLLLFAAPAASAQCDPNTQGHIRCGFYNEGYQDGARDAQGGQTNNYRRYNNKYVRQYEDNYRDGYNAGYQSSPQFGRWNPAQRMAYDMGYNVGQNDRSNQRASSPEQRQGQAASNVRPYFSQGYMDGYTGIQRRYDFPIGQAPGGPWNPGGPWTPPGGGTVSGTAVWVGRVDNRANIVLQGNAIRAVDLTNSGLTTTRQSVSGFLPRRDATVTVRRVSGRGSVTMIQQPNRFNNFEAIAQISDPQGGAANYHIEFSWQASNVIEDYQSGRVTWRGRVDQTVNIYLSGSDVSAQEISGNALQNASHTLSGYLARRPGNVSVRKRNGRGSVSILQQPSAANDYVAVIQINDPQGGADNYEIEITW